MQKKFIGIDVGGTTTKLAFTYSLGDPIIENKTTFPTSGNFEDDLKKIEEYIDNNLPVQGIGIGLPGELNEEKTFMSHCRNTKSYIGKPIGQILGNKYDCIAKIENDGGTAAMGEAYYGLTGGKDFLYVIWGTGVGGCIVNYENENPKFTMFSKEDRALFLRPWEDIFGGRNMESKYGKTALEFSEDEWKEIMKDFTHALLFYSDKLPLKNLIFGGGISIKQADRIREIIPNLDGKIDISISMLGEDAGLYGEFAMLRPEYLTQAYH